MAENRQKDEGKCRNFTLVKKSALVLGRRFGTISAVGTFGGHHTNQKGGEKVGSW